MTVDGKGAEMQDSLEQLKTVLLNAPPAKLERLSGLLLGSLLGVPVRRARSGDQRGGDGGVAGAGGRHLIYESRRYRDATRLDERSILGEIQQAVDREPYLEAWILVTTCEVREQTQLAIIESAEEKGIGAVIIDWQPQPLPQLAVLSAQYSECFQAEIGNGHEHLLADIAAMPDFDTTLKTVKSEFDSWAIGYEAVRQASHTRVREIWGTRRKAIARFGQDVAGGDDDAQHVRRPDLIDRLDDWWSDTETGQMAALIGRDGTGKTWTAIDWMRSRLERLPILIPAPSSSVGDGISSPSDLINFFARYLHELTDVRTKPFWEQRVRRLLKRPPDEGPVFLLFLDGLNQRSSCDWAGVFRQLQDDPFHQRVPTMISARKNFFDERLNGLRTLFSKPQRIDIGNYDLSPGGAFDQKLEMAGLSRDDLPDHLIEHAAVPRLFDLVVRLRDKLGSIHGVTLHRLLWEYGASAIATSSGGAFSEVSWRRFVLDLAREYRNGNRQPTIGRVTELSADATMTPDHVYSRVSGIIDGIFTQLDNDGGLVIDADFVHHALGLALVRQIERAGSDEDTATVLEQFLDPITGYDGRAETLRAAVSIALQRGTFQQSNRLGTLCTTWIHSQNLPDTHAEELAILAPELVHPLLDVIEASEGHALSTPRYIAVNALAGVDKTDSLVASEIAKRGVRWLSFISLEKRGSDADLGENSPYTRRCNRLRERIGTTNVGPVTVAGREFEIVDYSGNDLAMAAAQLLQGRPLKDAVDFFEAGAIHTAITGGDTAQESQSWLNVLNTVDPEETAVRLRRASETIRASMPERGVHRDLNKRVASLLLWRTGYADDAEKAWALDPKIDHWRQYKTHYLPDPSRSFFRLERRHAAQVFSDTDLPIVGRIQRAKDALLDPNFEIPSGFVDELISVAGEFDFSQTTIGRSRNREDYDWEHLSLALARCAPDKLANRERARLRQYAERPSEQRYGSALVAPWSMLLAGEDESAALQSLREHENDGSNDDENTIRTNMLIAEIQCEPPVVQVRKIMDADLRFIDAHLGHACHPPSEEGLDELLDAYSKDEQRSRLACILVDHQVSLSDRAFEAFSSLLHPHDANIESGAAWVLLTRNDPARLGALLDESGWSWSSDHPFIENIMGSVAITVSNHGAAFAEFASRIAPAKLLEALSWEERSREDVELAVEMLSAALFRYPGDPPESGLDISHNQSTARSGWYEFSAGDILEDTDNQDDVVRSLEKFSHPEKHAKRRHDIIQAYRTAVDEVRRTGAQLYLTDFNAEDFAPVLRHCPAAVDSWLTGLDSFSADFGRRVRLAEGFFVALCEALLKNNPSRGVPLWRALRKCLTTRFISHTGIDRLLHAVFSAPSCPEVDAALEEIYGINESQTDSDLMNLVIAARRAGRIDWLQRMVRRDMTSPCPAHRKRSVFLEPLLILPEIAGDTDWPSGEPAGVFDNIRKNAWILGQREAFANHWLRAFAAAETPEAAHAYWQLFKACSDRRTWAWKRSLYESHATNDQELEAAKQKFVQQEAFNLKCAIADNEKSWTDNFAGCKYPKSLQPWSSR